MGNANVFVQAHAPADIATATGTYAPGTAKTNEQAGHTKPKRGSPWIVGTGLTWQGIGYLLEEIMAKHFADAVQ